MILLHGTTRRRAEGMIADLAAPFIEPGGQERSRALSMCVENGPFLFGRPDEYARGKAVQFPDEGGPVILAVDVPAEIIARAINEWFPVSQGLVQFDTGAGMEELIAVWPVLWKRILELSDE
jgi:hypothetical protein